MAFPNLFDGMKVFVSPPGAGAGFEDGSGTFTDPYHSIRKGIESAEGVGTVFLRAGSYEESVAVTAVSGTWLKKIVVPRSPSSHRQGRLRRVHQPFPLRRKIQPSTECRWGFGGFWRSSQQQVADEFDRLLER